MTKFGWLISVAIVYVCLVPLRAQTELQSPAPDNSDQSPRLIVQTGHTFTIESMVFSPNGKLLASIGGVGVLKLWDVQTGREIRTTKVKDGDGVFEIVTKQIVTFSPDGKTLATTMGYIQLKLWDVFSGKKIKVCNDSNSFHSIVFSPDGRVLATGSGRTEVKLWDAQSCENIATLQGHNAEVHVVAFSPDGKMIVSGSEDGRIIVWDVESKTVLTTLTGHTKSVTSLAWSPNGNQFISAAADGTVVLWDRKSGKAMKTRQWSPNTGLVLFSKAGLPLLLDGDHGPRLEDFDQPRPPPDNSSTRTEVDVESIAISPDLKTIASGNQERGPQLGELRFSIKLWDSSGSELRTFAVQTSRFNGFAFSANGRFLASVESLVSNRVRVFDTRGGVVKATYLKEGIEARHALAISNDGKTFAATANMPERKGGLVIWDLASGAELQRWNQLPDTPGTLAFSADATKLAGQVKSTVKLWEVKSGKELASVSLQDDNAIANQILTSVPDYERQNRSAIIISFEAEKYQRRNFEEIKDEAYALTSFFYQPPQSLKPGERFEVTEFEEGILSLFKTKAATGFYELDRQPEGLGVDNGFLGRLVLLGDEDWVFVTPDGRFDTSALEKQQALHWIFPAEPLKPKPLELFSRQYFEPQLLPRLLTCSEAGDCQRGFRDLPSVAQINSIQPEVTIQSIRTGSSPDVAEITVRVLTVTGESRNTLDRITNGQLSSGAFDLRLFRDGQLVGESTPKQKLSALINNSTRWVSDGASSGMLLHSPEDRAWRDANNIFTLKTENLRIISPTALEYTFHDVRLPRDGRKQVEFTAYAFNADRVKSATTEPYKFDIPAAIANLKMKARVYLVTIGVNASESPAYNLRYAANDARKMQQIVGARLKTDSERYSEVVQIPLISDYDSANKQLIENTAQKQIIKGVFSLLAGHPDEVPANVLKQIPNQERIQPIAPEDTLIITFSGHGYTDQSGIFYLLPYDIGRGITKLNPAALEKTISSDELSLWMLDITAREMIIVIDACHSAAAIEGEGFKPGPMGSRGLGQLAYDKNVKVLVATQADNVALESNRLEQGLLSYALLEDGILRQFADGNHDKQLFVREWLSYAEERVPQLYDEIRSGKRLVVINGRPVMSSTGRDTIDVELNRENTTRLQSPHLFDFRRSESRVIFNFP